MTGVARKLSFLDRHLALCIVLAMCVGVGSASLFPTVDAVIAAVLVGTTTMPIALGLSLVQNGVLGPILVFVPAAVVVRHPVVPC